MNLRDNIKQILREEVAKRFEKPSPNMEKLIYNWLDKYVSNSQMYQEKSWESRTDFTWCKDGKEIMQVVLFFNTDDTVYDDKRKTEERDFEEGSLWVPKDVVKSMLSYLPVRQNYLNYLIEEWFEDKFGSEINGKMNRDDIFIHEFKAYPDTASVCVPPMEKPEDVTEEEMIELILKTTLFKRDVLLRREEEEPGFIEKTYLQKIRNKKREELEGGN